MLPFCVTCQIASMIATVTAFQMRHPVPIGFRRQGPCLFKPLEAASGSTSNHADTKVDLVSYFQPSFQEAAAQLSPFRIVDMVSLHKTIPPNDSPSSPNCKPLRQQLFTSPLVSVLYERVLPPLWEAGLRIGGPDAEYRAAADFLIIDSSAKPSSPRVLLDLSCGTGFVGQRFAMNAKKGEQTNYDHVFALDYSLQMLRELVNSIQRQPTQINKPLSISIIRGDAGSLPFQDGVMDAIHWGAAMHCVPDAEGALKEVFRVLKPGGRLYATTFLRPFPNVIFRFFTVEEMENIAKQAGFGGSPNSYLQVQSKGVYGIMKAIKYNVAAEHKVKDGEGSEFPLKYSTCTKTSSSELERKCTEGRNFLGKFLPQFGIISG